MKDIIKQELQQASDVLNNFMLYERSIIAIENAAKIMIEAIKRGNKIIACGNGGSMCDAMHFASELTGRYRKGRPPIAAIAISDPSHLSCVGNDYGYDEVFARWIDAHGKDGDVVVLITTSGYSDNILTAFRATIDRGLNVVTLTGNDGGRLRSKLTPVDIEINVPHHGFSDRTQEIHIKIIHILVHLIEQGL